MFLHRKGVAAAQCISVREQQDQLGKPYMNAERVRGIALSRGGQAKTRHAEGFEVVRAISSALGDV